jgi:CelD/BcsL family acetyltransferase involved in cellulose biosynthesis
MPHLRSETITAVDRLHAIRPHWWALWKRCPDATPFQSPEWLLPWWQHLARGRLCSVALWEGDRLVGLAPLFTERYFGLPIRRLALIGTGNTDYLDVLLEPDLAAAGADQIGSELARATSGWDFCDFQQLRPESPLLRLTGAPLRDLVFVQEVCPILPLAGRAFDEAVPGRLRKNVRYYTRRLEREGGVFGVAPPETITETLDALFELHGARWRKRKLPGVFTSSRVRRFHREAAGGFAARGWLRLYTLALGGKIRAVLYCFTCRGRGYYYAGGFDPTLARWSPGTALTGRAIQAAAEEGAREFDFLRGDEPYKYTWGAMNRANARRLFWRGGSRGAAASHLVAWEGEVERRAKRFADWLQEHSR